MDPGRKAHLPEPARARGNRPVEGGGGPVPEDAKTVRTEKRAGERATRPAGARVRAAERSPASPNPRTGPLGRRRHSRPTPGTSAARMRSTVALLAGAPRRTVLLRRRGRRTEPRPKPAEHRLRPRRRRPATGPPRRRPPGKKEGAQGVRELAEVAGEVAAIAAPPAMRPRPVHGQATRAKTPSRPPRPPERRSRLRRAPSRHRSRDRRAAWTNHEGTAPSRSRETSGFPGRSSEPQRFAARAATIRLFMSRTARSRPHVTALAMIAWPMLSSRITSIRATSETL